MTPPIAFALVAALGLACALAFWLAAALRARARDAAALHEAVQARLQLVELAGHWLWETDAQHRLRLWRPPAHEEAGWRDAVPLDVPLWDALAPADSEPGPAVDPLARCLQARAPLEDARRVLAASPRPGPWQLRGLPRHDAAGRFTGYIGSAVPVAPSPAPDPAAVPAPTPSPAPVPPPAQASAPAAAEAVESVADHESFIYSVSHDLRAPIRVVEGFARILKEDYGRALDRIGNDHVDRVLAAAARMNSMIDALLALSRLQSQPIKRQPVDLSQLTNYVLEDLRREHPERAVEATVEPGLVIQGDPTLMRIAIENLVGNAWKYSGQVPQARIGLRRERRDGTAVYVIEDNGAGFDMRFADRLFGVFQRLHSAKDFQGTGVGLASVRRILRRHGGDIWAESEVGKGARFYFTLP